MKTNRVKSLTFMSGAPIDIYDGWADVFVTLEDDDILNIGLKLQHLRP